MSSADEAKQHMEINTHSRNTLNSNLFLFVSGFDATLSSLVLRCTHTKTNRLPAGAR